MAIHETLKKILEYDPKHAKKLNIKRAESLLGIDQSMLSRWCSDPQISRCKLPADLVPIITLLSGDDSLMDEIAELAEGLFLRLPKIEKNNCKKDMCNQLSIIAKEFAEYISTLTTTISDNKISDSESKTIINKSKDLINSVLALKIELEKGR